MMAEQAARAPAGLISDVFDSDATRQAAYDFLESPLVHHPPMQRALAEACARAAAPQPFAFVAIDGTTLTLTDVDGTKVGINPGQTYTAKQLFTAMLVMSGNDAAMTIGSALGGVPKAVSEMNAMATHLQAHDTVAHTTNGLDAPGQTSSAYDLAMMFRDGASGNICALMWSVTLIA